MGASPTKRHIQAARYYLTPDDECYGDWLAATQRAGFSNSIGLQNERSQAAIAQVKRALGIETDPAPMRPEDDPDLKALFESMGSSQDWQSMAPIARRVLGRIATGRLVASTAQVASIKEIITRAEGKAGTNIGAGVDDIVRVVLLPTIDTQMGPRIDLGEVDTVDPGDQVPGLTLREAAQREIG